ncbi:hypothetical protein ACNQ05_19795 [Enterobacter cloacae complex sp.6701062]|jgi:hypothetical protein|uniref:Uncharacterized protein n=1 Tax=Enterobacter hormaechei TaxID=158836 RepID=A0AAP8KPG4_9ENTR|nr:MULTISPECIES: hypothetical protein [Enterobacteriaceae]EIC2136301.1 hypothetical protein [Citrobacter freundii]MCQ9222290.1 hypothetical protein [Klebsiella pneumoniae]MCQ9234174.1 hypothetical protein [Klebsiella pneumoniae]MCQ9234196.1 hypothetical protein [Klebsiella pneumoniae]MDW2628673.1 hypothetical protein [Enterobacter hormaechei]
MNKILLIAALEEIASREGHELNGRDHLMVRNRVAACLAAKERHRQRMDAKPYQWRKPERPR